LSYPLRREPGGAHTSTVPGPDPGIELQRYVVLFVVGRYLVVLQRQRGQFLVVTALASVAELRSHMGIDDSYDDTHLTRVLDAASAWIESPAGCDRTFDVGTSATKVFDPIRNDVVLVPDLVTVTSIKTDSAGNRTYSTTLTTADYDLWPYSGPPYSEVRARAGASRGFAPGTLVQIVGTWGYADGVPAPVKQAALLLAARWFKRNDAPFGILSAVDLGQFERLSKEDPDVVTLLAPYRRSHAWVLV
jgi:uncharacterized phiE125 gp8 family phage protein